jgi:signal transduction histidine kinase
MRLADYILRNREEILTEWEAFARTCAPIGTMNARALRDHANEMLSVIAADLQTPQSSHEQSEKSKGLAPAAIDDKSTAAEDHGDERAQSGFSIDQMIAEYRALRASVIRLWAKDAGGLGAEDLEDLTRFNEAIDQAVGESVAQFNDTVAQAREIFLGMLGHDLRNPLGAIYTSAKFMLETGDLREPHLTLTRRISDSAERALKLVGDLLDFTRARLGGEIPVTRTLINLGRVVRDAVDEIKSANPSVRIEVDTRSDQRGQWDSARLSQALINLLSNSVQHGRAGRPIKVDLQGKADHAILKIHNEGAAIPPAQLRGLFEPMKGNKTAPSDGATGSMAGLGLGLYIAERIVSAHGGNIQVDSSEDSGTTFTVFLPCDPVNTDVA